MPRGFVTLVLLLPVVACDEATTAAGDDIAVPGGKADGAAPVSAIAFDAFFSAPVATPELVAGGSVSITYDSQRMYEVYDAASPIGWFATSFHCYGYGCCEARFPTIEAHRRFDGGTVTSEALANGTQSFAVPADASTLEMWFSSPGVELRTWYCGCDSACSQANRAMAGWRFIDRTAWDSRFEQNYAFAVGGWPLVHGEDVKLVEARTVGDVVTGEIELQNLAWQKDVRVHFSVGAEEPWRDAEAEFAGMTEDRGFERWVFTIEEPGVSEAEVRFAIRYAVDGETLWDNNCGADYRLAGDGAVASGQSCD